MSIHYRLLSIFGFKFDVGRIWLKFAQDEQNPFGIALRKKRSHSKIAPGDIIQVADDYYIVHDVGAKKIQVKE